ncbi:MAG: hypothetical protein ACXWFX_06920 [Methylobacter sp.]
MITESVGQLMAANLDALSQNLRLDAVSDARLNIEFVIWAMTAEKRIDAPIHIESIFS